ncbi:MAG: hypothetical protein JRH20_04445 [Deltaproteobacteria bacterium]|nr:hypothetical protein [Deltaproteobacteria bacterium]
MKLFIAPHPPKQINNTEALITWPNIEDLLLWSVEIAGWITLQLRLYPKDPRLLPQSQKKMLGR